MSDDSDAPSTVAPPDEVNRGAADPSAGEEDEALERIAAAAAAAIINGVVTRWTQITSSLQQVIAVMMWTIMVTALDDGGDGDR